MHFSSRKNTVLKVLLLALLLSAFLIGSVHVVLAKQGHDTEHCIICHWLNLSALLVQPLVCLGLGYQAGFVHLLPTYCPRSTAAAFQGRAPPFCV